VAGDIVVGVEEKEPVATIVTQTTDAQTIAAQIVVDEAVWLAPITVTPSIIWPATTLSRKSLSVEAVAAMFCIRFKSAVIVTTPQMIPTSPMFPATTIPKEFPAATRLFTREWCTF